MRNEYWKQLTKHELTHRARGEGQLLMHSVDVALDTILSCENVEPLNEGSSSRRLDGVLPTKMKWDWHVLQDHWPLAQSPYETMLRAFYSADKRFACGCIARAESALTKLLCCSHSWQSPRQGRRHSEGETLLERFLNQKEQSKYFMLAAFVAAHGAAQERLSEFFVSDEIATDEAAGVLSNSESICACIVAESKLHVEAATREMEKLEHDDDVLVDTVAGVLASVLLEQERVYIEELKNGHLMAERDAEEEMHKVGRDVKKVQEMQTLASFRHHASSTKQAAARSSRPASPIAGVTQVAETFRSPSGKHFSNPLRSASGKHVNNPITTSVVPAKGAKQASSV